MSNFKKLCSVKIISVIVAVTFLFNSTVQGIDLSSKTTLRKPLLFNEEVSGNEATNRVDKAVKEVKAGNNAQESISDLGEELSIGTEKQSIIRDSLRYLARKFGYAMQYGDIVIYMMVGKIYKRFGSIIVLKGKRNGRKVLQIHILDLGHAPKRLARNFRSLIGISQEIAKKKGYVGFEAVTRNPKLIKRLERFGFEKVDTKFGWLERMNYKLNGIIWSWLGLYKDQHFKDEPVLRYLPFEESYKAPAGAGKLGMLSQVVLLPFFALIPILFNCASGLQTIDEPMFTQAVYDKEEDKIMKELSKLSEKELFTSKDWEKLDKCLEKIDKISGNLTDSTDILFVLSNILEKKDLYPSVARRILLAIDGIVKASPENIDSGILDTLEILLNKEKEPTLKRSVFNVISTIARVRPDLIQPYIVTILESYLESEELVSYSERLSNAIISISEERPDLIMDKSLLSTLEDVLNKEERVWVRRPLEKAMVKVTEAIAYRYAGNEENWDEDMKAFVRNNNVQGLKEIIQDSRGIRSQQTLSALVKVLDKTELDEKIYRDVLRIVGMVVYGPKESVQPSVVLLLLKILEKEGLDKDGFGVDGTYGVAISHLARVGTIKPELISLPSVLVSVMNTLKGKTLHGYRIGEAMSVIDISISTEEGRNLIEEDWLITLQDLLDREDLKGQYKKIVQVIDTVLFAKPELVTSSILPFMEKIFEREGMSFETYRLAGQIIKKFEDHDKITLIKPGSLADVAIKLPPNILSNPLPHYKIYQNGYFMRLSEERNISEEHKYSIALSAYRRLKRLGMEPDNTNIPEAIDLIMSERAKLANRIIFGPDTKVINIAHTEERFKLEQMELLEKDSGVADDSVRSFKGGEYKQAALDSIGTSKGPLTIFFHGHGERDALLLEGSDISFSDLGDALKKRGNLREVVILVAACYSYHFCVNLFNYLAGENIRPPILVSSSNYDRVSYGGFFINSLIASKGGHEGPCTIQDIFDSERNSLEVQDSAVFTVLEGENIPKSSQSTEETFLLNDKIREPSSTHELLELSGPSSKQTEISPESLPQNILEIGNNLPFGPGEPAPKVTPSLSYQIIDGLQERYGMKQDEFLAKVERLTKRKANATKKKSITSYDRQIADLRAKLIRLENERVSDMEILTSENALGILMRQIKGAMAINTGI